MKFSDTDIEFYNKHGYLVVKNFLDAEILKQSDRIFDRWIYELVNDWKAQGLAVDDELITQANKDNFLKIWHQLGQPEFRRRPNKYLINEDMYGLMMDSRFVDLAKRLLRSDEISMHGIFNARCQLPDDERSKTPIHQDSQYWTLDYGQGDQTSALEHHQIVTFWFPMQTVTAHSGAMQVISRTEFGCKLFDNFDYGYESTGFLGLSPEDLDNHTLIPIEVERGDLLIFDQFVPHGACENVSDHIRWSMDIRYELTATRPAIGEKYGFEIAGSSGDQNVIKKQWLEKAQA